MITLLQTVKGQSVSTVVTRNDLASHKGKPVKVSVIVPVYNAEHLLDETLESIEEQTLSDIEIICVNDASTDGSLAVLQKHAAADTRIAIIDNANNSGTGTTLNIGLSLANGRYIQYLGNDDMLELGALEQLYDYCEDNAVDFCQYGMRVINDDPDDTYLVERVAAKEDYHKLTHEYPIMTGPDLLRLTAQYNEYRMTNGPQIVRRDLLDSNGIRNLEGIHHEDMYYTYRVLLSAQRATLLAIFPYLYRIRHGSLEETKMGRFHTAEEFSALLISVAEMIAATPDDLFSAPDFALVVKREIDRYLGIAIRRYAAMPQSERLNVQKPSQKIAASILPVVELCTKDLDQKKAQLKKSEDDLRLLAQEKKEAEKEASEKNRLLTMAHEATKKELFALEQAHMTTEEELRKLKKAYAKLKNSHSYKIGYAVTAAPRFVKKKMKGLVSSKKSG